MKNFEKKTVNAWKFKQKILKNFENPKKFNRFTCSLVKF